ncbi:hypothetical protein P9J64_13495 [Deltaproteobacteria bacterium IMCC39524]|nr:hypothetical protein [Deltaproteobacteria bacterium IMCC39524]
MSEPILIQGQISGAIQLFDKFDPVQHLQWEPVQIGVIVHVTVLDQQSFLCELGKIDQQPQQLFAVIDLALYLIDHMITLV